ADGLGERGRFTEHPFQGSPCLAGTGETTGRHSLGDDLLDLVAAEGIGTLLDLIQEKAKFATLPVTAGSSWKTGAVPWSTSKLPVFALKTTCSSPVKRGIGRVSSYS